MMSFRMAAIGALPLLACVLFTAQLPAQAPGQIPLKSWTAPPYFQVPAELADDASPSPAKSGVRAAGQLLPTPEAIFVGIQPCRLMDTRDAGLPAPFGPPALRGGEARTIAVPASTRCNIPAGVLAYSLNFTVVPPGPLYYLSAWPTGFPPNPPVSILNSWDGRVDANAAVVPAGNNGSIDVFVSNASDVIIDMNGYYRSPAALWFRAGDTGIVSPDKNKISIEAGGQPQLTIAPDPKNSAAFNVGVGTAAPGEKLHLTDGNVLLEGGGETAIKIKRDQPGWKGYQNVPSPNPIFELGRIIQAGDGDPEFRLLYSDDNSPAGASVFEVDRKGIVASVKSARGSHFEGFLTGTDPQPVFRLNSYPKMRLEMGNGGPTAVDVAVQREDASTLTLITGSSERMRIDADGNVAIGKTAVASGYRLDVSGKVLSLGYDTVSDQRLKRDVLPLADVLAKLDRIRGVTFEWTAAPGHREIGVLAQEIREAFPELVTVHDAAGWEYQAVDYGKLSAVLLEAVKELKAEVDALRQAAKGSGKEPLLPDRSVNPSR